MGQWHKTGCALCVQNYGLILLVADNSLTKNTHRDPGAMSLRRLVP
jgi:hypothetical protein